MENQNNIFYENMSEDNLIRRFSSMKDSLIDIFFGRRTGDLIISKAKKVYEKSEMVTSVLFAELKKGDVFCNSSGEKFIFEKKERIHPFHYTVYLKRFEKPKKVFKDNYHYKYVERQVVILNPSDEIINALKGKD